LDAEGRWLTPLKTTSNRYVRDGAVARAEGDYSQTYVGDRSDTSPYPDPKPSLGISTDTFVRNMGPLIRYVDRAISS
jgi:hypothetical protein